VVTAKPGTNGCSESFEKHLIDEPIGDIERWNATVVEFGCKCRQQS